jgi:arylsulfatase
MLMTLAIIVGAMMAADPGAAQQVTGVPGSPSATTTIKGDQLLPSSPPFGVPPPRARRTSC